MRFRALSYWLAASFACIVVTCIANYVYLAGQPIDACIVTTWSAGLPTLREIGAVASCRAASGVTQPADTESHERAEVRAPLPRLLGPVRGLLIASARDGVMASFDGRDAWLTPNELLRDQAYEGTGATELGLGIGVHWEGVVDALARKLNTTAAKLERDGRIWRVRFALQPRLQQLPARRPDSLAGAHASAEFLARNVDEFGSYRYLVDGPTNVTLPGYSWARHAGATMFLADAYQQQPTTLLARALTRTQQRLMESVSVSCGRYSCVELDGFPVGVTALSTIALTHAQRAQPSAEIGRLLPKLTEFLRSLQRPDGEFKHLVSPDSGVLSDQQIPYVSSQIVLALALAYGANHDERDLKAARLGLDYQVTRAGRFFGSHYYAAEEHWTCQAMAELWPVAPNPDALDFCLRWHALQRRMQYAPKETVWDADGAYGVGPLFSPKTTPAASRLESATATLSVLRRARPMSDQVPLLEDECARAAAFLLRHQWLPGPRFMLANPAAVVGAMPGSAADYHLRNDYAQHAGAGLLKWAQLQSN
jgi:hypothetical protein